MPDGDGDAVGWEPPFYMRCGYGFPVNLQGVICMEEVLCNVELVKENNDFVIKIQSDLGGVREYRSTSFEEVLEQLMQDLQEEFETL